MIAPWLPRSKHGASCGNIYLASVRKKTNNFSNLLFPFLPLNLRLNDTLAQEHCKEIIRSKGLEKITVDELVDAITPRGRATVPDDIKAELLQRIRKFLQST